MEGRHVSRTNIVHDYSKLETVTMDNGQTKTILLNICDAAGQANVQNLAHLFLKNVSVCVFVYAINSKESFERVNEWHDAFLSSGKDAITVLVGNKSDLHDQCAVPVAYGARLKDDLGCEFHIETSAHKDIHSIKSLFSEICKIVVRKKLYKSSSGFPLQ